jgi:hypothetical protein
MPSWYAHYQNSLAIEQLHSDAILQLNKTEHKSSA